MPAKAPAISKKLERTLRELGQRIRDRRKALGVSSTVAAEAAEMSRVTLYRIERGEPSVAMGAYLSAISALGLTLELGEPLAKKITKEKKSASLPAKVSLSKYKQLKKLAWQLKDTQEVTLQEALDLYERNWRHVDVQAMDAREKKFIEMLLENFGRGRLLV